MSSNRSKAQWWYLSFADPDRPKGTQFLGAAVIQGFSLPDVITNSWELRINPGGEVKAWEFPLELDPDPTYTNRLLTRAEAENMPAPTIHKGNKT